MPRPKPLTAWTTVVLRLSADQAAKVRAIEHVHQLNTSDAIRRAIAAFDLTPVQRTRRRTEIAP